jgi:hypothetical protein
MVAQEKELTAKTEVKAVTVFSSGAQVLRKKTMDLPAGKSSIKFTELSPYMDEKSIQIKTNNEVFVLSVNRQFNYLDSAVRTKNLQELTSKLEALEKKIHLENTNLEVIKEELGFLKDNRILGGKNSEVSLVNLKQTADYYHERITALKMKEVEIDKNIEQLSKQKDAVSKELQQEGSSSVTLLSEIVVKVDTKVATSCEFELQYVVGNAGWYPLYDIRAKNIEEPVELRYKATIRQNTKEDWKNVQIRLSSSDPNTGSVAPELKTYFLDYYTAAPRYNAIDHVSGRVYDINTNESIPGAIVSIEGTTIATATNINGEYSLTITPDAKNITVSSIGYENQTMPIRNSTMNIKLHPDLNDLQEVVMMSTAKDLGSVSGKVAGVQVKSNYSKQAALKKVLAPVEQVENQTSVDFDIKTPYTIHSDNRSITVDMDVYLLATEYEYYCVPKIDKDVFLIAHILDWEKYNLLAGEANIFFENTFVGKSVLDVRHVSDTLKISLGRDKSIVVNREKMKDFTSRQFIGNKKEETKAWLISVKNNKKQTIKISVNDQVPVSTNEQIEVSTESVSGAELNKETGEVIWKFKLDPSGKKEMNLKYKVKYPKEKTLSIE